MCVVTGARRGEPFFREFVEEPCIVSRGEPVTVIGKPHSSKLDVKTTLQGTALAAQQSMRQATAMWIGGA